MILILIIGLLLVGIAVTMVARALTTQSGPSTETLEQIGAYGFAGALPASSEHDTVSFREHFDSLAGELGRTLSRRFSRFSMSGYRSRLISAGMYSTTPERLLGSQLLAAIGAGLLWLVLNIPGGLPFWLRVVGGVFIVVAAWTLPSAYVNHRGKKRREQIDKGLPDLIDLVVVTLEAGLSFPQSLRLAATKIKEPLSSEVRLTLQEQNMGITLVEALTNFLGRIDTPGVRMFARSIAQGETLGVSTGQIMRNLAIELRKRRRAYAEEKAQKAPVKMLFPILFFIMPSLFIVLLLPVVIIILDTL